MLQKKPGSWWSPVVLLDFSFILAKSYPRSFEPRIMRPRIMLLVDIAPQYTARRARASSFLSAGSWQTIRHGCTVRLWFTPLR